MPDLLTRWGFKRTLSERLGIAHAAEAKAIQKALSIKWEMAREAYGYASPEARKAFHAWLAFDPNDLLRPLNPRGHPLS